MYSARCILKGKITSKPIKNNSEQWIFDFKIRSRQAPEGKKLCEQPQKGKIKVEVQLSEEMKNVTLRKGMTLTLEDTYLSSEQSPGLHSYEILAK